MPGAAYALVTANPELPVARVLAQGQNIVLTDNGPGGTLEISSMITVRKNSGANVGTRQRLNFIEGANVTLTVADDPVGGEIDITIASAGATDPAAWHNTLDSFGALRKIGTADSFDFDVYVANAFHTRFAKDGTLMVGTSTNIFAGQDIAVFYKSVPGPDPCILTVVNPHTTGYALYMAQNDVGSTMRMGMFGSTWNSHSGVEAGSGVVWCYGGAASFGTHDNFAIRFVRNSTLQGVLTTNNTWCFGASAYLYDTGFEQAIFERPANFLSFVQIQNNSNFIQSATGILVITGTGSNGYLIVANTAAGFTTATGGISSVVTANAALVQGNAQDLFLISGASKQLLLYSNNVDLGLKLTASKQLMQVAPASPAADGTLFNGSIHFSIDEVGNTLKVKVKYSDGTVKNLTTPIPLS